MGFCCLLPLSVPICFSKLYARLLIVEFAVTGVSKIKIFKVSYLMSGHSYRIHYFSSSIFSLSVFRHILSLFVFFILPLSAIVSLLFFFYTTCSVSPTRFSSFFLPHNCFLPSLCRSDSSIQALHRFGQPCERYPPFRPSFLLNMLLLIFV